MFSHEILLDAMCFLLTENTEDSYAMHTIEEPFFFGNSTKTCPADSCIYRRNTHSHTKILKSLTKGRIYCIKSSLKDNHHHNITQCKPLILYQSVMERMEGVVSCCLISSFSTIIFSTNFLLPVSCKVQWPKN